jgi:acyl-CoA synthetase (AMP-forming)/AMP-acid ligase II
MISLGFLFFSRTVCRALLVYPPSLDFMIAFLACLKVGVVAVPVFPPNPARRDTLHMFSKITESSGSQFALTSIEYNHMKKLAGVKDALTRFKRPLQDGSWPENLIWIATDDKSSSKSILESLPELSIQPTDLAFLQYTSGSTSEPKGVMISHGNLAHNLTIITSELQAKKKTIVVSWLPQYHDMGLIGSYLGIIYCGGTGYYISPLSFLQRPMLWIEAVSKYEATHLQAPNFSFKLTARKFQASNYVNKPLNLSKVRHIINAAEPVDEESIETFYKAFGPFGLKKVIFPTYGLAEHTVFVCSGGSQIISVRKATLEMDGRVQILGDDDNGTHDETVSRLVGCGYPARQGVDVKIVDHDTCQELQPDRVGEIWVSSPSKAAGYYGKRAETKEDFFSRLKDAKKTPGAVGYLRTGDLGFVHKDELFICGRLKDLIILGGRNYYPQDIEATAESTSDKLRPGCSAAFTIDPTHEGGEEVALVMELREVPPANQAEAVCNKLANDVRSAVTQEHSLSISQIIFLKTKTVPKTTSGKIARAWCRKGFLAGTLQVVYKKSFKDDTSNLEIEQSAPAMTTENIAELRAMSTDEIVDKLRIDVSRIGQIPPDSIDKTTALITILDSLSISQFKGRLEGTYAVKISDEYLFGESTTLLKLAEVVKLGYAPDDVDTDGENGNHSSAVATTNQGSAGGLAGVLGCPPGVVCCTIQ